MSSLLKILITIQKYGAEDRTRTDTACATNPSSWRVYQFHHYGIFTLQLQANLRRALYPLARLKHQTF